MAALKNTGKASGDMIPEKITADGYRSCAYEYLCRLEEARKWMEAVLKEPLPPAVDLQENLRNGVYLAKLANFMVPEKVPLSRIYDIFQHRWRSDGLQFRHTDNINYWIEALKTINFPKLFIVDTADVYDKKDMPKVIYCIHALSFHLFSLGQAPLMNALFGKVQFDEQDIGRVLQSMKNDKIILPPFHKISGLVSQQTSTNVAALLVKLIEFNKAIDDESEQKLLEILNSNASLALHVIPDNIEHYKNAFKRAKSEKASAHINSSCEINETNIHENLLNWNEVQGHIREVNICCAWQNALKAIQENDKERLKKVIDSSFNQFKDYKERNVCFYLAVALALKLDHVKVGCAREMIQIVVHDGNRRANEFYRVSEALAKVKLAILNGDENELLNSLKAPSLKFSSQVSDFAAPLYLEELQEDFKMSKEITYEDLKCSLCILNKIAELTSAVTHHDCDTLWNLLSNSDLPFMNVKSSLKSQYLNILFECRQRKLSEKMKNSLLTFVEIQECIDEVNSQNRHERKILLNVEKVNEAVKNLDNGNLVLALRELLPNSVELDDAPLCMILLKEFKKRKHKNIDEALRLEDIEAVACEIDLCKRTASKACENFKKKWKNRRNSDSLLKSIENKGAHRGDISIKAEKKNHLLPKEWFAIKISEEIAINFNPSQNLIKWCRSDENNHPFILNLSSGMTVNLIGKENKQSIDAIAESVIKFQAIIRGFLVRKKIEKTRSAAIVIQRWWRRVKRTGNILAKSKSPEIDMNHYARNVDKVIKIQACWRGYRCRRVFCAERQTRHMGSTSFSMLKRIALTRRLSGFDYSDDLKVQTMKSAIVNMIKVNRDMSRKLEEMDTKIGLLVQNRISVDTIAADNKKLQANSGIGNELKGIKAFSKEGRRLLDGYQQLFYLLQTEPAYLTRLIVRLPSRLNHVIQSCVFSLFNYGSNSRDAYLLLRLFRSALLEEVDTKLRKPADAITGNPLVLTMALAFVRQSDGQNTLKNILGFLIEKVLNDKVILDTNPVDIYRRWMNQMETESGKPSHLPQSVDQEEALSYPEVVCRLNHNLRILKSWVKCFLERLVACINRLPYALRFIAKLLKNALQIKFPKTPEKDILKIIGNLIFYQYINLAIVAPDAFYIVSFPPGKPMKMEQRRNLASIAKILHFAATKKGFGEESEYLKCLNPFIVECHKEMKFFCKNCCAVEDLEEHFHMTKYSEASLIDKPRIYITLEEIKECHKLLNDVRHEVAPDSTDPIHEVLGDLGEPPSLSALVGCSACLKGDSPEGTFSRAGKTQVCLELNDRFRSSLENPTDAEKLFIRTKDLIRSRLNELEGNSLEGAVSGSQHADIASNLAKLELAGLVKRSNDYDDMIKSILCDVLQNRERRIMQKQELNALAEARRALEEKKKFYEEQLAHYEKYLNACLENLMAPNRRAGEKRERSISYSGTRLREKGILMSLDGVPPGQLKNVQFEISTTKCSGVYSVRGCFMGVEVEKIDLDIQQLLKFQFEGLREMDLFGKASINVNLLLHLLNKKFHAR